MKKYDLEKRLIFGISLIIGVGIIPLVLLLLLPVILIKQIVKLLAKRWKPEFVEVVSGYSKFMAVQDVYTNPNSTGSSVYIFQEGMKVNFDRVEEIAIKVLHQKRFAKAKQLLVKWLGFYFWKENPQFSLKDHLILHTEVIEEGEVKKLAEETFLTQKFSESKPLWEIHFFRRILMDHKNDSCGNNSFPQLDSVSEDSGIISDCCSHTERSGAILFLHHTLADWYSAMDVAEAIRKEIRNIPPSSSSDDSDNDSSSSSSSADHISANEPSSSCANNNNQSTKGYSCEGKQKEPVEPKKKEINDFLMALYFIKAILTGPTEIVYLTFLSFRNTLQYTTGINPLCEHNYFQIRIPDEVMTEVARKAGVATIPLVMACFAGALRQALVDKGLEELPEEISTTGPVPVPLPRPKKLDNFFSLMPIQLPIREADRKKRLKKICSAFESMRMSTAPLAYLGMFEVIGSLFAWMVKLCAKTPLGAISHSILPGPNDLNEVLGVGIDEAIFSGAMPYGKVIMLGFFSVKTNGLIHFKVHGDKALFPTKTSSRRFLAFFVREVEAFNGGVPIKHLDL